MILEQVKWKYTRYFLPTNTKGKFTLEFVIKTTTCILVLLEIEDTSVKETIQTHIRWHNTLYDQFSWILDGRFTSTDLKR